jgi:olefin beta-lactone synthetase
MNCVELFLRQARMKPKAIALWHPATGAMTFGELLDLARRAQGMLRSQGITTGSSVLFVDMPGPRLYALVLATLALGATVVAVEPWLPVREIDRVIRKMRPKTFVASTIGQAWGVRVPAIRDIESWRCAGKVAKSPLGGDLRVEDVESNRPGLIAFTSGTTGRPKGVVREQGYLVKMYEVYTHALGLENEAGADLCIFANFVLANLASGRPSVIVPPTWRKTHLRGIDHLAEELQPHTVSCGPAFLEKMLQSARLARLESIHVGGALTDAALLERAFNKWPGAHFVHVYGSSEAEPVALSDAREAVRRSRDRGLFQVLCAGRPIDAIDARIESDTVWITGPHVCRMYVGNEEENFKHKRQDADGRVWHDMGDRIELQDGAWWYTGRSGQPAEDFHLEQSIYSALGSSRSFVHRTSPGSTYLVGEDLLPHANMIRARFRAIDRLVTCRIQRDRRHRARIDRRASLAKGAPWLPG